MNVKSKVYFKPEYITLWLFTIVSGKSWKYLMSSFSPNVLFWPPSNSYHGKSFKLFKPRMFWGPWSQSKGFPRVPHGLQREPLARWINGFLTVVFISCISFWQTRLLLKRCWCPKSGPTLYPFGHKRTQQKDDCLWTRKLALLRHQIWPYLDLGCPCLQNCKK